MSSVTKLIIRQPAVVIIERTPNQTTVKVVTLLQNRPKSEEYQPLLSPMTTPLLPPRHLTSSTPPEEKPKHTTTAIVAPVVLLGAS